MEPSNSGRLWTYLLLTFMPIIEHFILCLERGYSEVFRKARQPNIPDEAR